MVSEQKINKFKLYFYVVTIIVILVLSIYYAAKSNKKTDMDILRSLVTLSEDPNVFFPADLVPHIVPPEEDDAPRLPFDPLKDIC